MRPSTILCAMLAGFGSAAPVTTDVSLAVRATTDVALVPGESLGLQERDNNGYYDRVYFLNAQGHKDYIFSYPNKNEEITYNPFNPPYKGLVSWKVLDPKIKCSLKATDGWETPWRTGPVSPLFCELRNENSKLTDANRSRYRSTTLSRTVLST